MDNILRQLDPLWRSVWIVGAIAAVVGSLAIAALFTLERLSPLRRQMRRLWLRRWLLGGELSPPWYQPLILTIWFDWRLHSRDGRRLEEHLIERAAPNGAGALFGLPVAQFVGQLAAAAESILDEPLRSRDDLTDHEELLAHLSQTQKTTLVRTYHGLKLKQEVRTDPAEKPDPDLVSLHDELSERIQKNLDALQISLGQFLETAPLWAAGILCATMIWPIPWMSSDYRVWVLCGTGVLASGFFAEIIRGLAAWVMDLGRRG